MITDRLVEHCHRVDGDRDALADRVLDWITVTVGGATHADSSPAVLAGINALSGPRPAAFAGSMAGVSTDEAEAEAEAAPTVEPTVEATPTAEPATVLPSGTQLSAADAAFANGTLAHSLDFDDTHLPSSLHPGAPTIAAALATAEAVNASTDTFCAAIAGGYDVACTVGELVGPDAHYERGFHVTATCGTFGAVAAAGIARGLTADELTDAFGIAGSQAAGSLQFLENGAWNKRLHAGFAARRGVEATTLAAAGVLGAANPIDGAYGFLTGYTDDPNRDALKRLSSRDAVAATGRKPYPCCRYLHSAIDGLRQIAPTVDPAAIERVELAIPTPGIRLTADPIEAKRRPESVVDCQFSAPFLAAVTLREETAAAATFLSAVGRLDGPPQWDDPEVRRLMDATSVTTDETVERRFPEAWSARVSVETATQTHEQFVSVPRGEPANPMSDEAAREKTEGLLAGSGVDPDRVTRAVNSLRERSVGALVDAATK